MRAKSIFTKFCHLKQIFTYFYTTFATFCHFLPSSINFYYLPPIFNNFLSPFTNFYHLLLNFILLFINQKWFFFFFSSSSMHQSHHLVKCLPTGINSLLTSFLHVSIAYIYYKPSNMKHETDYLFFVNETVEI